MISGVVLIAGLELWDNTLAGPMRIGIAICMTLFALCQLRRIDTALKKICEVVGRR